jgi:hypothetical protein
MAGLLLAPRPARGDGMGEDAMSHVLLRQMFEELVAAGEWEVAKRDSHGTPISWRMTDIGRAKAARERGGLQYLGVPCSYP